MDGGLGPFRAPLILSATTRPRGARWRDTAMTLLLWCTWLYMLLAAIGALWLPPFVQVLLPVDPPGRPWEVIRIALLLAGIAAFACTMMLLRVVIERRRFAGEDRRLAFARPDDASIAADLGAAAEALPALREARRMIVHHDEDGRVVRVETGA